MAPEVKYGLKKIPILYLDARDAVVDERGAVNIKLEVDRAMDVVFSLLPGVEPSDNTVIDSNLAQFLIDYAKHPAEFRQYWEETTDSSVRNGVIEVELFQGEWRAHYEDGRLTKVIPSDQKVLNTVVLSLLTHAYPRELKPDEAIRMSCVASLLQDNL